MHKTKLSVWLVVSACGCSHLVTLLICVIAAMTKMWIFKSKGGLILLLWEVCIAMVIFNFYHSIHQPASLDIVIVFSVGTVVLAIASPAFGLLGDAVLGRHKLIRHSLQLLWVIIMVHSTAEVVVYYYGADGRSWWWSAVSDAFHLSEVIVCCAFLVNSLLFGIDQLMDAPSWQVSSFISWYGWCYYIPNVLNVLLLTCIPHPWSLLSSIFMALLLTLALCVELIFHKELVKEPISPNPLKLIYGVVRYARKHKYPVARSSLSYWDKKKWRIDLSKSMYGGPFTSEEVEDVKSFIRMACVILIGAFFTGYFMVYANTESYMFNYFQDKALRETTSDTLGTYRHCMVRQIFYQGASFLIVAGVPLYEIVLYPLFQRYSFFITTRTKFEVGMFLLLLHQLSNLALDVAGHMAGGRNVTLSCFLETSENDVSKGNIYHISFYWLGMPKLFSSAAYYLIFTSTSEFLCAQSPYSMKGLLVGVTYSLVTFSIVVNFGLMYLYRQFKWRGYCSTLYFVVSIVLTVVLFVIAYIVAKWYSRRQRRENTNEEQLLQETYNARSSETYTVWK